MNQITNIIAFFLTVAILVPLTSTFVFAAKQQHAESIRKPHTSISKLANRHKKKPTPQYFKAHFTSHQKEIVYSYYLNQYKAGVCPSGLAKKHNGCTPPGLTRQWQYKTPLHNGALQYALPAIVLRELGNAPHGHQYVRVGADVLLITIGTQIVIDAIEDLFQLN